MPLHLINTQNPCPTKLHSLILISPKWCLISGQVLSNNPVPILNSQHCSRITNISNIKGVPNDQHRNCSGATQGIVNLVLMQVLIRGQESRSVSLDRVLQQCKVTRQIFHQPILNKVRTLGTKFAMPVINTEEMDTWVTLELCPNAETILVFFIR
ncbi:hypothetical protein V8G54_033457 [Vigna mungo]|uniref:Uncharacterized protein n=1 Tax=Vigna mungo TaxID=3915 RepID=A0AAQ3MPE2_VIGMU